MKAIYLVKKGKAGQAFELRDIDMPVPANDEVLIKVECFGLNYADVMARNGLYKDAPPIPSVLGYEVVGKVEKVGSNANQNLVGKRVVAFTRFGGYAEYAVTRSIAVAEIDDMDAGLAACIATQFVTAYFMAFECVNIFEKDRVLIHAGAGGVGTALIQLCRLKGAEIFTTAGNDEKLKYTKKQGADHAINYRQTDYVEGIRDIIGKKHLDITFNPIAGSTFKKDLGLVGSGGKVVVFGGSERSGKKWGIFSSLNFVRKMGLIIPIGLMMRSKSVIGVNMLKIGDNNPKVLTRCLRNVVELVKTNQLNPYVGAKFNASQIAEAHDLLENRNSIGKVVVYWDK
ncbi:zinc-binding dehydrogenase [Crocinitomix catalasitica]|nr:zinc-binding dehydrogenase [Crocinitomix catalasitica]